MRRACMAAAMLPSVSAMPTATAVATRNRRSTRRTVASWSAIELESSITPEEGSSGTATSAYSVLPRRTVPDATCPDCAASSAVGLCSTASVPSSKESARRDSATGGPSTPKRTTRVLNPCCVDVDECLRVHGLGDVADRECGRNRRRVLLQLVEPRVHERAFQRGHDQQVGGRLRAADDDDSGAIFVRSTGTS